jgi:hypothetical protein
VVWGLYQKSYLNPFEYYISNLLAFFKVLGLRIGEGGKCLLCNKIVKYCQTWFLS